MNHKILHISSKDKSGGTNSNFRVNLSQHYWLQAAKSVVVKQITIPNVFYNVRSNAADFTYNIASVPSTVSVTPGNYNITDLMSALQAALIADGVVGASITLDATTQKVVFASTTAIEYLTESDNPMAQILGITTGSGADVTSFNAPSLPDLTGVRNVLIASNTLGENNFLPTDQKVQDCVAIIPLTESFGAVIHYISQHTEIDDWDAVSQKNGKNISQIDIRVLDNKTKTELDLTNHDIDIILKIFY